MTLVMRVTQFVEDCVGIGESLVREECLHNLVKCAECGLVWDGFAQCSHPVW